MRRRLALLLAAALALVPSCREQPSGANKVMVIGGQPSLKDPALGPLTTPQAVLLQNVAQGLVRFDASGNIISGLAERWNVSDDGLSYIFRIAPAQWPDGSKITAQQVARILKRQLSGHSKNALRDTLGAVEDVVAMTDRVIEIRLVAPRPNLLPLLAQPEMAVIRNGYGSGPFSYVPTGDPSGELRLLSEVVSPDEEVTRREEVLLGHGTVQDAVRTFAADKVDLVLGGTFADAPVPRAVKLPRNSLRFDPALGLFGLVPTSAQSPYAEEDVRKLLTQAIDRDALVAAFNVPGLAARATLLEPGLEGVADPVQPVWFGTPLDQRQAEIAADATRIFGAGEKPIVRILLPEGPGAEILLRRLAADWGRIGFTVERAKSLGTADFRLIDAVAPSTSPAWYLRSFRCGAVPICDPQADELLDAARLAPVPAQRAALLYQASQRMDEAQLFIPLAAPVRWSLVSARVPGFAGNRYARHTLTDLGLPAAAGGR